MYLMPEKQKKAYEAFYEVASNNEILETKATVLIQMAASMAIGCYP